jgi:hypothetical protein
VCELEGPMPILKTSKTLKLMRLNLRQWGQPPIIRRSRLRGVQCRRPQVIELRHISRSLTSVKGIHP